MLAIFQNLASMQHSKSLAANFGKLMCPIVATIDRYGLKQRHLNKYRRDVSRFFRDVSEACYESDVAVAYLG